MSYHKTLPPGHIIYTATKRHTDEKSYGVLFLAESPEDAEFTVGLLGLDSWGRLSTIGELTPDGTLTTWDEDNEEKETP